MRSSLIFAFAFAVSTAAAQQTPAPAIGSAEIAALARAEAAIAKVRDSVNAQLAMPRNKTSAAQQALREKLLTQTAEALRQNGLTDAEYRLRTYVVSTDNNARRVYDSAMVVVTGAQLPGMAAAPTGGRAAVAVPAGPVGAHIGHVINAWGDTPMGAGLLPTAIAEARIAATHAGLASRQPTNLDYMKTHAGHVLNAIDPTLAATGPGLGYGLKKAANLAATHIELAAGTPGASANVINHARHIATSTRNTIARADQIVALAQKIQAATSATEAAALAGQMSSLCEQLIVGADTNADGRITWEAGEGGLQQAEEHVKLMLAAEGGASRL